jgi:hypothetical protein
MSMYHMMCKANPAAGRLLGIINLDHATIPRLRDVWANADMTEVTVLTRTGGGNRAAYNDENTGLSLHPLFLRTADEEWDSTYATFVFTLPAEGAASMRAEIEGAIGDNPEAVAKVMEAITMDAETKFKRALEALSAMR